MNSDNQLAILEKYRLTPNEYYILTLILEVQDGNSVENLSRFLSISDEHKRLFRESLVSLQSKGIILKSYKIPGKGEKFNPLDVELNKNVIKTFWKAQCSLQLMEQLSPYVLYLRSLILQKMLLGIIVKQ